VRTRCLRLCGVLFVLFVEQPSIAAQQSLAAMEQLATDKGCYLCHTTEPVKSGQESTLPFAPSWVDIAKRYQRQRDAEDRLTGIVLQGSGPGPKDRHWQGKVSEVGMLPNIPEVDESEARQLVRWILSFERN